MSDANAVEAPPDSYLPAAASDAGERGTAESYAGFAAAVAVAGT